MLIRCVPSRKLVLGAAALFLALAIPTRAQEAANPAMDKVFDELVKPGSPGCALGVYRGGKIIYAKGYGLANIEQNVLISPQSVFDIGSTSKQFTAASILLLEKQGKLSVNDDVRKWVPELPDYSQKDAPKITILRLLNHTSGLRDYLNLMGLAGINIDSVTTDEDALAVITRQKALNFPPGSEYLYSNSGFFLLSLIVKRASGKTLRDFAAENIFQPLGMTHTQYRDDHTSLIPNRALAYDPKEKGGGFSLSVSYFEQTGDGAVHTSIEDLLKWDENFYSAQIGGKEFLAEIQERAKLATGKTLDYAKGLVIGEHRGLRTVSHGGSWGGYRAQLLRFPDQHFSVASLCNVGNSNPSRLANRVADIYLADSMKPEAEAAPKTNDAAKGVSLTPDQLRALTGIYRDPKKGDIWRISAADGKLRIDFAGRPIELRAVSPTEFEPVGLPFQARLIFEPATQSGPRKLRITGSEDFAATFEAIQELSPTPAELAAYVGDYWSDELEARYKVAVEEGKLVVHAKGLPPGALRPTIADEFEVPGAGATIKFRRGPDRQITSFVLNAGRTRGMIFTPVKLEKK